MVLAICVLPALVRADEELTVEEDQPAEAAAAPRPAEGGAPAATAAATPAPAAAAPAAKPAAKAPAKAASAGAVIAQAVAVSGDRVELRITGKGALAPRITQDKATHKMLLIFPGTIYQPGTVILGQPGLGAVSGIRGSQHGKDAWIVITMTPLVKYSVVKSPGVFTLSLNTRGEAGPDTEVVAVKPAPAVVAAPAPAGPSAVAAPAAVSSAPEATGGRARVMHAMVDDLPDRSRLVVTADGVLRYKIASQDDGKELVLTLFDVDLAWAPARLAVKDGPIADVQAETVKGTEAQVRVNVKLRSARPYHVRRDQNQVVVEVDKVTEGEAVQEASHRGGDLTHKVTLNVQNEDLPSLIKALAFEAGFDNVVLNPSVHGTVTITLREIGFAKALNLILSPNSFVWKIDRGILRVALGPEFDAELDTAAQSGGGAGTDASGSEDEPISTRVFRLKHITMATAGIRDTLVDAVTSILLSKTKGKLLPDFRSNSIVVTDATVNFGRIQKLIRDLDVTVPQVMIRARLVQVNHDRSNEMGINWTLEQQAPSNPSTLAVAQAMTPQNYSVRTGWLGPGFNLDATLNMMQTRGDAKLLLNPSIFAMQDNPALVTTSEVVSYSQITQVIGANGLPVNTQTFQQAPIPMALEVTPHVNPGGSVHMRVQITMTSVTATHPTGPPDTSVQQAITALDIRDKETGVIGGILRDFQTTTVNKVPILGDLPWFLGGAFFRTESTQNVQRELVLFLTPTISEDI